MRVIGGDHGSAAGRPARPFFRLTFDEGVVVSHHPLSSPMADGFPVRRVHGEQIRIVTWRPHRSVAPRGSRLDAAATSTLDALGTAMQASIAAAKLWVSGAVSAYRRDARAVVSVVERAQRDSVAIHGIRPKCRWLAGWHVLSRRRSVSYRLCNFGIPARERRPRARTSIVGDWRHRGNSSALTPTAFSSQSPAERWRAVLSDGHVVPALCRAGRGRLVSRRMSSHRRRAAAARHHHRIASDAALEIDTIVPRAAQRESQVIQGYTPPAARIVWLRDLCASRHLPSVAPVQGFTARAQRAIVGQPMGDRGDGRDWLKYFDRRTAACRDGALVGPGHSSRAAGWQSCY